MLLSRTTFTRLLAGMALTAGTAAVLSAQADQKPLPLKYVGPTTVPAITAGDLMTRLYKYADDSMMGREVGTEYHLNATAYIEREVRRLGLVPAGDDGGYFQNIHPVIQAFDTTSTMSIDGVELKAGHDFIGSSSGSDHNVNGVPVLAWGGTVLDTLNAPKAEEAAGKLLYIRTLTAFPPGFDQAAQQVFIKTQGYQNFIKANGLAAGFITAIGDSIPPARLQRATHPPEAALTMESDKPGRISLVVTDRVMSLIFGAPAATVPPATVGKPVTAQVRMTDISRPGRNVVAILPGSDPKLKGEYVAIGAHNDHIGFFPMPVMREHDSLRIYNQYGRPAGAEGGRDLAKNPITPEEWTTINQKIADLRKIYPPRPDSIANGADDDGTGTVSVLEIAEAFAKGKVKPKRSILFVWHAGEEKGMWGSGYFMDHPTVPRDSIVAQLNIDMVGRGAATDVTGQAKAGGELHGGDKYLQLVGSRRLSTELGDLVESVNKDKGYGINFDYNIDADGHPQNIYCRSDHWSYAKWGVPVVFFTTGGHADYHQVTDEPQYIRYESMARIDHLIFDIAVKVADLDHRVVVDHPKPNPAPAEVCKQ
jgi:peptidase M28-like protein